jgi:2-phosphosulfolactate phosphatase
VTDPTHRQTPYAVRFEWGPTGAAAIAADAEIAVVVDVLSFTTTLTVAVERGMTVLPYRWRDARAAAYAADRDAVLAVGRLEGRDTGGLSLSPAAMAEVEGAEVEGAEVEGAEVEGARVEGAQVEGTQRVVLPSPNGSAICFALADSGLTVVGACLRNRAAVARWLSPRLAAGDRVAVVAAGERWPDGSLRPAVEDLWGAGAVLSALGQTGPQLGPEFGAELGAELSPEARAAALAFDAVRHRLGEQLLACASGRELHAGGFGADVGVAAKLDASGVVPLLVGGAFTAA